MSKLLVCIPFHYSEGRVQYLMQVLENFNHYEMEVDVIVDTNTGDLFQLDHEIGISEMVNKLSIIQHKELTHPFHLTWVGRKHIRENIDNYDYVMYTEDDMMLPWENFKNYIQTFHQLWPRYIPGLVRVEKAHDKLYITDSPLHQKFNTSLWYNQIDIRGLLTNINYPYHAQWIMPHEALKSSMRDNFVRMEDNRELAASYPMWELNKTALVKLTSENQIDPLCYTYHLPNNYSMSPDSSFGKIEVDKLFI
ncbi:MAG TPA: hypothetical protein VK590_01820 [Saprospiraceae bacterium]|nr:hypothetical protein [Saprospiraceae bacterium]